MHEHIFGLTKKNRHLIHVMIARIILYLITFLSLVAGLIWLFWEQLPIRLVWPYLTGQTAEITGEVQKITFTGDVAGEQTAFIYLPEGYDSGNQTYRVLYHLHGAGVQESWAGVDCNKVAEGMEKAVADRLIDPMIVVCLVDPTRFSMWTDSFDGKVLASSALISDLIPYIDANYRTISEKSGRALQGFSMGGFGAAMNGFKHHDLFQAIIIWDGALHNWQTISTSRASISSTMFASERYFDEWSPWTWAERSAAADIDLFMVVGTMAATRDFGSRYKPYLAGIDREFVYHDSECPHSMFCMIDELGREAYTFLGNSLRK